jgi:hypothetical protein
MYESLYRFLIKHKRIDLPGVGGITLQVRPAESQFVNQSFFPPHYYMTFDKQTKTSSRRLLSWLSTDRHISESEAAAKFDDFVSDLSRQLEEGKKVDWNGVGVLEKEATGEVKLIPLEHELAWLEKTPAKKVLRENAEHVMLVGETEKSSVQMTELLANPKPIGEKRRYWWLWPLAVIIAIFIFLGWYFSEHGISGTATGNNHKTAPAEAPSDYK